MPRTLLILLAMGCDVANDVTETTEVFEFDDPVSDLRVELDSGGLVLTGTEGGVTRVTRVTRWSCESPESGIDLTEGTLEIRSSCPRQETCATDHFIEMPRDVRLQVDLGAGGVELVSWDGDGEVTTGAGAILGTEVGSAHFAGNTGAGSIELEMVGPVDELDVATDQGAISIAVPAGRYRLDLSSDSGGIEVACVEHDSGSDATITAATGGGGIELIGGPQCLRGADR